MYRENSVRPRQPRRVETSPFDRPSSCSRPRWDNRENSGASRPQVSALQERIDLGCRERLAGPHGRLARCAPGTTGTHVIAGICGGVEPGAGRHDAPTRGVSLLPSFSTSPRYYHENRERIHTDIEAGQKFIAEMRTKSNRPGFKRCSKHGRPMAQKIRFHLDDHHHRDNGPTMATPVGNTACRIFSSPRLSYRHAVTLDERIA
jgi:hypothetical protein